MDYQTYRPMAIPSKTRKPFTRNTFAEQNYNYAHQPKTNQPPRKNTQNLNHVGSNYWNLPKTSTNSVSFPDNPQPTQDHSENYPFFQQNKNKQHTPYNTNYLSSDDDDHYQPDIFPSYTKEYRTQRSRQSQPSQKMKIYPQNPTDIQNPQQMRIQNPFNTPSFQTIQPKNPILMHSYQPTQMQNEIPLPYYLQQHEITKKSTFKFFTNAKCRRITTDDNESYLMGASSITSNKPLMVFTGTDPEYSVEDYLNAVTANLILNIGPEPINTPLPQNWIQRRTALLQKTLDGAAPKKNGFQFYP